ncbi:hypothetical protein N8775_03025 [Candidatus Pelagibacter ubique]|nr:hypothetical protein [Candidatus Pelagibacter ubique]
MIKKKYYVFVLALYISLLLGLFLGEDFLGGAAIDYRKILTNKLSIFKEDLLYYFKNYSELNLRHSPIFQVIHIFFLNTFNNDLVFRVINIHINLLIVVFFYFSLKVKLKKNLVILTAVLFILPSFRSYSIWPDSFLFGFLFFMISIYLSQKFITCDENKKIYYAYLNVFSVSIASYISPNFAPFSIFYLYIFFEYFKISKNLLKIILLNCTLSLPAFFYIFIMDNNFLDLDGSTWVKSYSALSLTNLINKIIILPTIFIIYFIPFLIIDSKLTKIFFLYRIKNLNYFHYLLILLPIACFNQLSYEETNNILGGGGLFYNLLKSFNFLEFFLSIISSISILVILLFTVDNLKSNFFIFCLILSNPQLTIYSVYFDLILITCIFLFFDNDQLKFKNMFNKRNNALKFFLYYLCILLLYVFKDNYYNFIQNF